ncbi:membrane protein insertion efficiency factor YidD [Dethiobacter alkaliphilus]|uniref:membrane protein insertion efficiency factor YidD n=1 Tax=Dethiobacter alkaliphilus TaxID=427926 RepID=UPI000A057555|nr:membrane protein insertion efficiency factor YidD [Dethiobacter alkaliphilus]
MKWPLIALIWIYQKFISPMKRPSCRFYPSCSQYALEALQRYGFIRGTIMALWRLLRCNPFNPGGYDPVEPQNKGGH